MGMSTRAVGLVPPDDHWRAMKAVHDACKAAGIDPPVEVESFFDGEEPGDDGMEVEIPSREWGNDHEDGLEVDVSLLPPHVRIIRFVNSW